MLFPRTIDSPEAMADAVYKFGIVPFFKNVVPGWSIEEMTAPGFWWDTEDVLGPWDWKVDIVNDGIAYGKFLGGKACFATKEWYRTIMKYKREDPAFRIALGEYPKAKPKTNSEKLQRIFAKTVLDAIRENGSLESKQIRQIMSESVTPSQIRSMGPKYKGLLSPSVKKNIADGIIGFLQEGTWILTGNIERVYRGANLTYSGWQLAFQTTPEALWGDADEKEKDNDDMVFSPAWAKRFEEQTRRIDDSESLTAQEAFKKTMDHVLELFPQTDPKQLESFLRK